MQEDLMWHRRVPFKDQSNDVSMEVNTSLADKFARLSLRDKDEVIKKNESSVSQQVIQVDKPNIKQSEWHKDAFNTCGREMKKRPPWYGVSPFKRPPVNVMNQAGQGQPFRRRRNYSWYRNDRDKPSSSMHSSYVNEISQGRNFRREIKMQHQKETREVKYCDQRGLVVVVWKERLQVETKTMQVYYK